MGTTLRTSVLALAALAATSAGCSLLGLDAIELPSCDDNAKCEPLNTRDHITADSCMRWQCAQSHTGCVMATTDSDGDGDPPVRCGGHDCDDTNPNISSSAHERCDGLDNNCDGVIDDGQLAAANGGELITNIASLNDVAFVRDPSGSIVASYQFQSTTPGMGAAGVSTLPQPGMAAMPGMAEPLAWASGPPPTSPMFNDVTYRPGECSPAGDHCDFRDVVSDTADSGRRFVAAVSTVGCATGQLRIGFEATSTQTDAPANTLMQRGPLIRSDIIDGVDVGGTHCSGASRGGSSPGAARPAIASYVPDVPRRPQALVAWLGADVSRDECGGAAVDVDTLGVWLETETDGPAPIFWVNATGDTAGGMTGRGTPQVLGQSTGGGRPAVLSLGGAYVVGFGGADGSVTLRTVAPFADPTPAVTAEMFSTMADSTRPTPNLTLGPSFSLPSMGGAPDHVAIAMGPATGGVTELGVVWQTSCSMSPRIRFQRVSLTTATGAFTMVDAQPIEVTDDTPAGMPINARDPSVVYMPDGFVTPGYMGATAANSGGWVVAWIDRAAGGSVRARRIAEVNGHSLGPSATVDATTPLDMIPSRTFLVPAGDNPNRAVLAYGENHAGAIAGATLLCALPPASH